MIRLLLCTILACISLAGGKERRVEALGDMTEIYSRPADSLPPVFLARKDQTFAVWNSIADDSGRIWFCIRLESGGIDTGYADASNMMYVKDSTGRSGVLSEKGPQNRQDKARRHAALKKYPEWPSRTRQAVRSGEIILHMNVEQLEASWGKPEKIRNAFMIGLGAYEVYFYKASDQSAIAVTLDNGNVTGWTEE